MNDCTTLIKTIAQLDREIAVIENDIQKAKNSIEQTKLELTEAKVDISTIEETIDDYTQIVIELEAEVIADTNELTSLVADLRNGAGA